MFIPLLQRVAKAWIDLTSYSGRDCRTAFGQALFNEPLVSTSPDGIVLVRDITFAALSEETLLPFHGKCHIAYVPRNGVILGLSKLARATRCLSNRLQRQEKLAADLLSAVQAEVAPLGVVIVVEAVHIGVTHSLSSSYIEQNPLLKPDTGCKIATATCGSFADKDSALLEEVLLLLGLNFSTNNVFSVQDFGSRNLGKEIEKSLSAVSQSKLMKSMEASTSRDADSNAMVEATEVLLRSIGEDPTRPGLRGSAQRYVQWLQSSTLGYSMQPVVDALLERRWSKGLEPATPDDASLTSSSDIVSSSSEDLNMEQSPCYVHLRENRGNCLGADTGVLHQDPTLGNETVCETSHGQVHIISAHFTSQCEHHLLPFYGTIKIAYKLPSEIERSVWTCSFLDCIVTAFSRRLQVQERLTQQIAEAAFEGLQADSILVVCESSHMCMVARGVEKHASSTMTTAARGEWAKGPAERKDAMKLLLEMKMR